VVVAVSLFRQQATITVVLHENVTTRKAASDLRGCLNTLIALESHHVETVSDLHEHARMQIEEIRRTANHPEEQAQAARLAESFAEYLRLWQSLPPSHDEQHVARLQQATQFLERKVLATCMEIESFNDWQIQQMAAHHERVLGQLAWGMAGIGALGGIAGLVFGYGVARGLSRSIHRLQVRIRDAAGKLAPTALPEIVFIGEDGFHGLNEQLDRLTSRIEQVVQQLQEREREVLRAEQLAAVGQLAAGIGHEIRNPLTAIKMLVQSAIEAGDEGGLSCDDLFIVEAEIRRMERSLQTFLEFARPPKPERRLVELQAILERVLGLTRGRVEKQKVAVQVEIPEAGVTLWADPNQLQQLFVNLVLNALDAMPHGGKLTLQVRAEAGQVIVEVRDTGPGVSPELIPRLFEPFVSNKDTGLGLGLAISRRIAEDHGGTVSMVSSAGSGACFRVILPLKS
jgi:signal transduction histidine kinase